MDGEAARAHGCRERECGLAEMLVAEFADEAAGVVEDAERGDAERRDGLGVQHEHGFERVVEVGVEIEFEARDFDGVRPLERERGRGVGEGGKPDVGLVRGAAKTVAEIFRGEERERWIEAEREVFPPGRRCGIQNSKLSMPVPGGGSWRGDLATARLNFG